MGCVRAETRGPRFINRTPAKPKEKTMLAHVCPWWLGYLIDNPLRRWIHNPEKIIGPYVGPGMTVLDVGCGMGLFSIAAARLVGNQGRVIAVDLQQKMLDTLRRRAEKAGMAHRIEARRCEADHLGVETAADFALAFAMVHEVPDTKRLLAEIRACLKPSGRLLVAEPRLHVSADTFQRMLEIAAETGFQALEQPPVPRCRAVVFAVAEANSSHGS
jgi:2-polyprenyl-3-methyl-5-hydroxy-6-metoxy-1,4-benzoquinol methylase